MLKKICMALIILTGINVNVATADDAEFGYVKCSGMFNGKYVPNQPFPEPYHMTVFSKTAFQLRTDWPDSMYHRNYLRDVRAMARPRGNLECSIHRFASIESADTARKADVSKAEGAGKVRSKRFSGHHH